MKPKIRIKGFNDAWEYSYLYNCLDISTEVNKENKYGKNDVLSVSDDFGVVNQIKLLGRSYAGKSVSGYKILLPGQIVYTKSPLRDKPFGIIKENNYQAGIVSVLYAVYNAREGISSKYIQRYFEPKQRINKYLIPLVNKGAKNTMNISDEMSLNGKITKPVTICEQQAICSYFDKVDELISTASSRLASLKQVKEASLQAMFPQKGETVPKIRFKGFEGEWTKVKLNDICFKKASNLSESSLGIDTGQYAVYGASGYLQNISTFDIPSEYVGIIKDGSGVGRTKVYPAFTSILGTMQYILAKEDNNIRFIAALFENIDFSTFISGSGIPHIYFRDYGEIYVMIPSLVEQQAIASYFTSLDKQIALQTQQLEKLRQIKAACLDKMFV
jgi:putative restriction modification system specificity subunit